MRLDEADLLGMLSSALHNDYTARCIAEVVTPYLRDLAAHVGVPLILPNAQALPEAVLDELASELLIRWYDYSAGIQLKRDLVARSESVHRRMGTPNAIEQVASAYFGPSTVEEWYEYDGEPYHFRVRTPNMEAATDKNTAFRHVVERTQNLRSVFDGVQIDAEIPTVRVYVAMVVQSAMHIIIPTQKEVTP